MKKQATKFLADQDTLNLTDNLSINLINNPSPFSLPSHFSFNMVNMTKDAPHNGEMHPDGDEVVFVISGEIEVTLEFDEKEIIKVNTGEGLIIPKGIWHKIHIINPAQLVNIVPGPNFEFRMQK